MACALVVSALVVFFGGARRDALEIFMGGGLS
jgi:hypothetical protein